MLSMTHLMLLAVVLLLLFGPNKLPDIGRSLGRSARDFKKALRGEEDLDVTSTVKRLDDQD